MSPVLYLFVIQAFLDTLQMKSQPVQYAYFHENKNGNAKTCKGRLLSQDTTPKGMPFFFSSSFYVDDSFFVFENRQELLQAVTDLDRHFARFRLIMILGIKWNQVREKHIKNKEVRGILCNIPNIDAYIAKRTAVYLE